MSNYCYAKETRLVTELFELELENGVKLKATPDHLMMMSDGTYKKLSDIEVGDELKEVSL